MPTFATPVPISLAVELGAGDITIAASETDHTVVTVGPADEERPADREAAQATRVDRSGTSVVVRGPRRFPRRLRDVGTVRVRVELPTGSRVDAHAGVGHIETSGRVGECRVGSGSGNITLEATGTLRVGSASGDVAVHEVDGDARITVASGDVWLGAATGAAHVKNASGDSHFGTVTGDLRMSAASGDVTLGRVLSGTTVAKTASGEVTVERAEGGVMTLHTASGDIRIGVEPGVAAFLDARSESGRVHRDLERADGPEPSERTVEIHARTGSGDVTVRRAAAMASA